jgi:hypothetical protein
MQTWIIALAFAFTGQGPELQNFEFHFADREPVHGVLASIDLEGHVIVGQPPVTFPSEQLLSFSRPQQPNPDWPQQPYLLFTNGDRLVGDIAGGDRQALTFLPAVLNNSSRKFIRVPFSSLAAAWVKRPPAGTYGEPEEYDWNDAGKRSDILIQDNGDSIRGTIDQLSSAPLQVALRVPTAKDSTIIPLDRIRAMVFDPALSRSRPIKGQYVRIVTRDGSRLSLQAMRVDASLLYGRTTFGSEIEIPLIEVVSLHVLQGKSVYLHELKPIKEQMEPYNGVVWPWAVNRGHKRQAFRLGFKPDLISTHDFGLSTHPRTRLTYKLGGGYRLFEARVGLDALRGKGGSARVQIFLDNREVTPAELKFLSSRESHFIRIGTSGAEELTLFVDYGSQGDVRGNVNWCDARLIR